MENSMPINQCTLPNGGSGYKWGSKGKCYKNKRDAIKQGVAIEGSENFAKKASAEELNAALADTELPAHVRIVLAKEVKADEE